MKRLESISFSSFNELSDWIMDNEEDIEVINIQQHKGFFTLYYFEIT